MTHRDVLRGVLRLVKEGMMLLGLVAILFGWEFFQHSTLPSPDAPYGLLLRDAILYYALFCSGGCVRRFNGYGPSGRGWR